MAEEDGLRKQNNLRKTIRHFLLIVQVRTGSFSYFMKNFQIGRYCAPQKTTLENETLDKKYQDFKMKGQVAVFGVASWCKVIRCGQTKKWLTQMGKNQHFQDLTTDLTKWCYIRAMTNFLETPQNLVENSYSSLTADCSESTGLQLLCQYSSLTKKSKKELQVARGWTLKECKI